MQYYQQENINPNNQNQNCTTPLWQQVIDWFRVKYRLVVGVEVVYINLAIGLSEIDCYCSKINAVDFSDVYPTYEEAREKTILKAIKQVKKL